MLHFFPKGVNVDDVTGGNCRIGFLGELRMARELPLRWPDVNHFHAGGTKRIGNRKPIAHLPRRKDRHIVPPRHLRGG